ncbi:SDR family oxidoreductase [Xenorhabdus bovienii]|uniref:NAD(P)H-binding protein n=1 Tax=Xenorhabdus bovienii TaxID=40576 RepID=UPI001EDECC7F|nr:NAD(P)H-binding protein [Xenorhabdus bovienii]MCG3470639.1 SDR family oxidoreductase [Xenorhabdus bovienii]
MKSWLIFGAGRGVGRHLATMALQQNRPVTALVRNVQQAVELSTMGANVIHGDACDKKSIEKAIAQAGENPIVFSTIGGGNADHHGNMAEDEETYYQIYALVDPELKPHWG